MVSSLGVLRRWGGKTLFSVFDQGTTSGANFVLNIILVRLLAPNDYGSFAVAFSIFLFFSGFQNALILEPMSVLGPARHEENLLEYLGGIFWINLVLSDVLSLILLFFLLVWRWAHIIFPALPQISVDSAIMGLVVAMPFILISWFLRRACYLQAKPDLAMIGSGLYAVLLLIGVFVINRANIANPFSAYVVMGLASTGASLVLFCLLKINVFHPSLVSGNLRIGSLLKESWSYGKWVFGSSFVSWLSNGIYIPFIGAVAGLTQAGVFRAMQNLVLPLGQTLTALGLLFIPEVSRRATERKRSQVRNFINKISMTIGFIAGAYVILLLFFGPFITDKLYSNSVYSSFAWVLPLLGITALIDGISQGPRIALRAFEKPNSIFWSQVVGAAFSLTLGMYLIKSFGLFGAVIGYLVTTVLMTGVIFTTFWTTLETKN